MKRFWVIAAVLVAWLLTFATAQIDEETGTLTNDKSQARLRVAHVVFDGPKIDLMLNSEIPVNKSLAQAGFPPGYVGAYMYLKPDTYQVALVPTGMGLSNALIGPVDATLEAGHRYTLALVGQIDDGSVTHILIDDTAVLAAAREAPEQGILMLVNNLADTASMEFVMGGQGPTDVPYGGFAAAPLAQSPGSPLRIATDVGVMVEEAGPGMDPAIDFFVGYGGRLTDDAVTEAQSGNTSDMSPLSFLRQFSGLGFEWDGNPLSFETFLNAVEATGLAEMLETGGPYLMFPPTDAAFEAMGEDQLAELMANREALTDLVLHHIIKGFYPRGTLSGEENHLWVHENLLGAELRVLPDSINGEETAELQDYMVANGNRVAPITVVLLPPAH